MANDVALDGSYFETRHGTVYGIPRVLDLHKNHCSDEVILKVSVSFCWYFWGYFLEVV